MPSLPHEAILELFRNRPVLAAELLAEVFSVSLPAFTEARIESADIADVIPRELRADLLVLLLDGQAVLVILVEAQLSADPDKSFAWPAYVVGARARYRCPACLLVVTHDATLATRLARPIVLGPGEARLTPFVLGPQGIPVVTEEAAAHERPELAVLSAMAHGRTDVGLDVAIAAIAGSAGIADPDRKAIYMDVVLYSLGEAARRAIEALMLKNYRPQSDLGRKFFAEGHAEGLAEGHAEGLAAGHAEGHAEGLLEGELRLLLRQLERRLAQSLRADERARLAERVREIGAEQVGDLVLDLSPEELAAWLASKH
ncbi:hypothetical protein [Polyangium fumosum]|uniref:DUF4351 domain-containing protein n=1 Tax=Polyangium fumosum TaxID=889272 RepID=A0A4U1IU87_9BACT|nr:hypothetical protein [Polyangium fumosum]TKC97972.1 hypothetical protein E8A74_43045 [Polyangium fumosum]